jgi:hypothetical protein
MLVVMLRRWTCVLAAVLLFGSACRGPDVDLKSERIATAETYLRGVYGSDPTVVDRLAGESITVSYPIFESLFGSPTIRGREAVKLFVVRFGQKWSDSQFEFREAVCDGDEVALLWSFRARNVGSLQPGKPATNQELGWGGITLLRFDQAGKIVSEVGYESEPRPTPLSGGSESGT